MEVAFNSLIVFILFVFPVIVFRKFYFQGIFYNQSSTSNWLTTFYMSLFPGFIIQIISFYSFTHSIYRKPVPNFYPFFDCLYIALNKDSLPVELFDSEIYFWVGMYIIITIIIAFLIAQFCWIVVRYFELDLKFQFFRFGNYFHYFFSGECLKFPDNSSLSADKGVILTEVDTLLDLGAEGPVIYKGFYKTHTTKKGSNELHELFLTDVSKFRINSNIGIPIPGHLMIIKSDRITNINLKYIVVAQQKYERKFISLMNLSVLLTLLYNKFWLPTADSIFFDFLERAVLFVVWLLFSGLMSQLLFDLQKRTVGRITATVLVALLIIAMIYFRYFFDYAV